MLYAPWKTTLYLNQTRVEDALNMLLQNALILRTHVQVHNLKFARLIRCNLPFHEKKKLSVFHNHTKCNGRGQTSMKRHNTQLKRVTHLRIVELSYDARL